MTDHAITREFLAAHPLPLPQGEVDKDARGRVTIIGGNKEVPGAVLLASEAALRAGAGKVQLVTVHSTAVGLAIAMPEARVVGLSETSSGDIKPSNADKIASGIQRTEAVLIGPGLLDDEAAGELTAALLSSLDGQSFVLDAAALTGLRSFPEALKSHAGRTILTPHAGEMATFLDIDRKHILKDPVAAARQAAAITGSVVVMKGGQTHIASPQGEVWHCDHGNIGLATSGSGDCLAGIIIGLLARGVAPLLAAQWGVFMHGEAGSRLMQEVGPLGYLAREIPGKIPSIMRDLMLTT